MSKKINYILFSTLGLGVFSFGAFNLFPSTDEIIAKEKNMISIHKEVTNSSLNNSPISLSTYNTDSIRLNVYEPISDNVTLRNFSQKREFIINDFFMLNVNSKKKIKNGCKSKNSLFQIQRKDIY